MLDGASVSEVARRFKVSRESVHVWLPRYAADQGLGDRSSRRLIDEIDLHLASVLLGDGIRLYDAPAGKPVHLQRAGVDSTWTVSVRYCPPGRDDQREVAR